uniref:C2H2-type domain-containing protein n=3 Tax=Mesocestoides corti TaxID=53468 RepID=A0A5K3ES42_MESCO
MRSNTMETFPNFVCPDCETCFGTRTEIKSHYKTNHVVEDDDDGESTSTQDAPLEDCGARSKTNEEPQQHGHSETCHRSSTLKSDQDVGQATLRKPPPCMHCKVQLQTVEALQGHYRSRVCLETSIIDSADRGTGETMLRKPPPCIHCKVKLQTVGQLQEHYRSRVCHQTSTADSTERVASLGDCESENDLREHVSSILLDQFVPEVRLSIYNELSVLLATSSKEGL